MATINSQKQSKGVAESTNLQNSLLEQVVSASKQT